MGYANIIDGQYVDDDFKPSTGPDFDAPKPRTFADQIDCLLDQRDFVSPGWLRIFDETLERLKAVNCTKRDGVELTEIAFGGGEMIVGACSEADDRVVRGILNRMRQVSALTCSCCGRQHGASYRRDCLQTLCERCHVHMQLGQALEDILDGTPNYTQVPLIEWDALPVNIQMIIAPEKVKVLRLASLDVTIRYVEPETLQQHWRELALMKRALVAMRG